MQIVIEKNVPMPEVNAFGGKRGANPLYPFRRMKKGDSFALPITTKDREVIQKRLGVLASQYSRKLGARFSTRTLKNEVRVWRVA